MTKSDLIKRLAEANPHLYMRDIERIVVDGVRGDQRGPGPRRPGRAARLRRVLGPRRAAQRVGRNPRTGDEVAVPNKVVPYFKTGKELRERLNGGR